MKSLIASIVVILLASCTASRTISYDFKLSDVKQGGKNAAQPVDNSFTDSLMSIHFQLGISDISIKVENNTHHPIKIIWDEAMYVNELNESLKILHKGVKYIDRNSTQTPTVIVPNSVYNDVIVPTDKVSFNSSKYGSNWSELALLGKDADGRSIRLYLPVVFQNVVYDYVFNFDIFSKKVTKADFTKRDKRGDAVYQ